MVELASPRFGLMGRQYLCPLQNGIMISVSTASKLRLATAKCGNIELKCIEMRLAAGLCPDPLGKA